MRSKGYVFILCLTLLGLVSVLALASLTISQLSLQISQTSQQQLQMQASARIRHWQQLALKDVSIKEMQVLPSCPAQYALWSSAQISCDLATATSMPKTQPNPKQPSMELAWSSVIARQHLQLRSLP